MKSCDLCGAFCKKSFYLCERSGSVVCCECGNNLVYHDDLCGYVFEDDYQEFYTDDELADVEVYELVQP